MTYSSVLAKKLRPLSIYPNLQQREPELAKPSLLAYFLASTGGGKNNVVGASLLFPHTTPDCTHGHGGEVRSRQN
jgi:hypothetical protein